MSIGHSVRDRMNSRPAARCGTLAPCGRSAGSLFKGCVVSKERLIAALDALGVEMRPKMLPGEAGEASIHLTQKQKTSDPRLTIEAIKAWRAFRNKRPRYVPPLACSVCRLNEVIEASSPQRQKVLALATRAVFAVESRRQDIMANVRIAATQLKGVLDPSADHAKAALAAEANDNLLVLEHEFNDALDQLLEVLSIDDQQPPLGDTAQAAADYIRQHPGDIGDNIAKAINCTPEHFRRIFGKKLRPRGFFNNGDGYHPPPA